jgi:predicted esterase YcpF (UPF0227 family)
LYIQELLNLPGAGFAKFWRSTKQLFSPKQQNIRRQQINENLKHKISNLNSEDHTRAQIANQAYEEHRKRQHIGDYEYQPHHSGKTHAVYRNHKTNTNIIAFKGTSNAADIVPDIHIAAGTQHSNIKFSNAHNLYQSLKEQYHPEAKWETTGHSLGGAKAMYVAQQNGLHSYAFNPGYVAYTDDKINTDYDKHHVRVIKGDPISNSILEKKLTDVQVMDPSKKSWNPINAHTINNFTENKPTLPSTNQ